MAFVEILDEEESPKPQSTASKIAGTLGGLGVSAAKGIAQKATLPLEAGRALGQFITKKVGLPYVSSETGEIGITHEAPPIEPLGQFIQQAEESVREKLPKGFGGKAEEYANKFVSAVPSFATLQGGIANAATRALGSEAGRELAKKMDLGEVGQFMGSIAGAGLAAGLMTPRNLKNLESLNYSDFEKSVPAGSKTALEQTKKTYDEILKDKSIIGATTKWIKDNIGEVEAFAKAKKADVLDSYKLMKGVNKAIRENAPDQQIKDVLVSISKSLKSDIINAQKQYPSLNAQALIDGSSISYARNNLSPLRKWLRKYVTPTMIGGSTLGTVIGKQPIKALLGVEPLHLGGAIGLGVAGRGLTEAVETLYKSPAARQEILGRTVPQVLSGAFATREPSKKKHQFIEILD